MTEKQYERAWRIKHEIADLKDHKLQFSDNGYPVIEIAGTSVTHDGLREAIENYVNNRVAELEKEFAEL